MRLALYPGTFDPITYGHLDVLKRALNIFDLVEVTVAVNAAKKTLFTLDERCALIKSCTADWERVQVSAFEGLVADYAKARGAVALVRGLRNSMDLAYERTIALANRRLNGDVESVFFMPAEEHFITSASLVREIHRWGGDVSSFVPPPVITALNAKHHED